MIEALGVQNIRNHCFDLGDHLIARLDALGVRLVGPRERQHRAPHIYVIALPAAEWLGHFEENGVRVSPERGGIRVSFGMFNTFADVDRLIEIIQRRGVKPSSRAA